MVKILKQVDPKKDSVRQEVSAGGIVVSGTGKNRKFLVIHRNHMDDWSLPKGHVESSDKDLQATAVREVKEETGIEATIQDYIDSYSYLVTSKKKKNEKYLRQVHWFLMKPRKGKLRKKNHEISEARWVDSSDQFGFLDYREDRDIIRKAKRLVEKR